ncbi:Golgin subfamily A member 5 [Microtus ochrogaster]|uniref:Golgin subfamily A member 5 n=1 Tax=Microtus ochrogaster TaxID=79684 RepID=A0A8J6GHQ5_MICOH|nr:Golgin subfamily A member 5 [Microtus ochrogaster]
MELELRHEKEMQKEEIQKRMSHIHQLRSELQDMEAQQVGEAESAREQLHDLQDQKARQKTSKQELETKLDQIKQEFHYMEQRTPCKAGLKIERNQLTNKTLSNSSQSERESQLHQLTETLIQQLPILENLSTEKSSLAFQLERLEQQVHSVSTGSSITMSGIDSGEETCLRNVPDLLNNTETNLAGMYGKLCKAASSTDQFSIRLGIFLRRHSIA